MKSKFLLVGLALSAPLVIAAQALAPPVAKKVPQPVSLPSTHCDKSPCVREDDYFWLRQTPPQSIEEFRTDIIEYLTAENAYTTEWMKTRTALRDQIFGELSARANSNLAFDAPYENNGYSYFIRHAEGQDYPVYWRKNLQTGKEEVLLDGPALSQGLKYFSVSFAVSPDNKKIAYGIDRNGERAHTLYVKDLGTGAIRTIRENDVKLSTTYRPPVWSGDSQSLFYLVPGTLADGTPMRDNHLMRFDLAASQETSVYMEKDGDFYLSSKATTSGKYIVITSDGNKVSQVRIIPASDPQAAPTLLSPKKYDHEYTVDHVGERFIIVSNMRDGNNEVYTAPESAPTIENWKPLLAKTVMTDITEAVVFKSHLVLVGVTNAIQQAKIVDLKTLAVRNLKTDDKLFAIQPRDNMDPNAAKFRFEYASHTRPLSLREVDLSSGKVTVLAQKSYPGHDPADYVVKRVWSTSFDGTKVPSDVIFKKGVKQDGKGPLYLWVYGNYGSSLIGTWLFSNDRLSLLDRGVTVAIGYPRGGGELGFAWGKAGNQRNKINSFKDTIAIAEDLVAKKYAARDRLALEGVSAGGLVTGYIANNRPDLFKAIVMDVPFVDLLNTMSDATIPLTTQEYVVWGNPANADDYKYMAQYSPYDNVGKHDYPSILVTSSLWDSQVYYWEPSKWVAKLRANKTDNNPLLLSMGMAGGHGGGSGISGPLAGAALHWTFVIDQIGTRALETPSVELTKPVQESSALRHEVRQSPSLRTLRPDRR